jgi:hypothetical protein
MAELVLTFDWDGKTVHKETKGFVGSTCVSKTKFIEDALGFANDRKFKMEYYEEKDTDQGERIKN